MGIKERMEKLFSFTRSEIRGIFVLCLLMGILLTVRFLQCRHNGEFQVMISGLPEDSLSAGQEKPFTGTSLETKDSLNLCPVYSGRPVDPNTAGYAELVSAGIPPRAAVCLIRYREKGGRFSSAGDLLRIYGMDSVCLSAIEDHLTFPYRPASVPEEIKEQRTLSILIEMNSADTSVLSTLPGIGRVLSARIVRYRDLLGGYYSAGQLSEVYGINDSLSKILAGLVRVDTTAINKIDLNKASMKQLLKHPYLDHRDAEAILAYRRLTGSYISANQLIINYIIPEEKYHRIAPYLCVGKH